jgi:DUF438 domain-containing protein
MSVVEELELLVAKLNKRENREQVCDEARRFLSRVGSDELRMAEKQLIHKGVPVGRINKLCSIHIGLMDDPEATMCAAGSEIIDILFHEHEVVLDWLEELEAIGHVLQSRYAEEISSREVKRLPMLLESLLRLESHTKREEQAIFPEIKTKCSPHVLTAEHEHIFIELNNLYELSTGSVTDTERFRQKAVISINAIVPVWWQHIFKENNILFPCFLDSVTDGKRLAELKSVCDEIGYLDLAILK